MHEAGPQSVLPAFGRYEEASGRDHESFGMGKVAALVTCHGLHNRIQEVLENMLHCLVSYFRVLRICCGCNEDQGGFPVDDRKVEWDDKRVNQVKEEKGMEALLMHIALPKCLKVVLYNSINLYSFCIHYL